ncbi:neural/ectodermal development factor IMP-L2 [Prorops nasuta]|uniref:neural/ectodermal development factor IMP-L2 n=1 Tax=Prorops nasuta TaxID=863751 RepID=UPI0034CD4CCF
MRPFVVTINWLLLVITVGVTTANPVALLEFLGYSKTGVLENGLEQTITPTKAPKPVKDPIWLHFNGKLIEEKKAREGDRVELRCIVVGSPPPKVYWLRGPDPKKQLDELESESVPSNWVDQKEYVVQSVNSTLVIDCVSPKDAGLIHCAGITATRKIISTPVELSVTPYDDYSCSSEQKPIITEFSYFTIGLLDQQAILPCKSTGKPRPTTSWHFYEPDNERNVTSSRYKVMEDGNLLLDPVKWEDRNVAFTCTSTNEFGSVDASAFVYPSLPSSG